MCSKRGMNPGCILACRRFSFTSLNASAYDIPWYVIKYAITTDTERLIPAKQCTKTLWPLETHLLSFLAPSIKRVRVSGITVSSTISTLKIFDSEISDGGVGSSMAHDMMCVILFSFRNILSEKVAYEPIQIWSVICDILIIVRGCAFKRVGAGRVRGHFCSGPPGRLMTCRRGMKSH